MAKKNDPIVLRTMTAGNGDNVYRAQLLGLETEKRQILIEAQTAVENEIETENTVVRNVRTLVIYPDFEGLKKEDAEKRSAAVKKYLEKNTVAQALEEVGNEVIKGKKAGIPKDATAAEKKKIEAANEKVTDTVISWQPKIQKDLNFPVKTRYESIPTEEKQISITTETEYKYKEVHSAEIHYRIKPRDFIRYVSNFLESQSKK